jgi:hypothetical protein
VPVGTSVSERRRGLKRSVATRVSKHYFSTPPGKRQKRRQLEEKALRDYESKPAMARWNIPKKSDPKGRRQVGNVINAVTGYRDVRHPLRNPKATAFAIAGVIPLGKAVKAAKLAFPKKTASRLGDEYEVVRVRGRQPKRKGGEDFELSHENYIDHLGMPGPVPHHPARSVVKDFREHGAKQPSTQARKSGFNPVRVAYNLKHKKSGDTVGSVYMQVHGHETFIPSLWVRPDHRKRFSAFRDLVDRIEAIDKPVNAHIADPHLARVGSKLAKRNPKVWGALDQWEEVKTSAPGLRDTGRLPKRRDELDIDDINIGDELIPESAYDEGPFMAGINDDVIGEERWIHDAAGGLDDMDDFIPAWERENPETLRRRLRGF